MDYIASGGRNGLCRLEINRSGNCEIGKFRMEQAPSLRYFVKLQCFNIKCRGRRPRRPVRAISQSPDKQITERNIHNYEKDKYL